MKLFSFVLLSVLVGCSPVGRDIIAQYKNTARTVGITPVYPPEEHIQVGDIFVQSVPYTKEAYELRSNINDEVKIRFGTSKEMVSASEKYMHERLGFLRTTTTAAPPSQRDTIAGVLSTRGGLKIESLPLVAFPEVTADAGTNFGFSVARLFQSIGIGGGRRTQVILNFNDVRKYGVPGLDAYYDAFTTSLNVYSERVDSFSADLPRAYGVETLHIFVDDLLKQKLLKERSRLKLIKANTGGALADFDKRCRRFLVVTEVYLTRKITFTYQNAEILAIAAKRLSESEKDKTAAGTGAPTAAPTSIVFNAPITSGTNGENASPISIVDPSVLRASVASSIEGTKVGAGLVFDSFTARGAAFSQTFERPIVIGYDAVVVGFPKKEFLEVTASGEQRGDLFEDCLAPEKT